MLTRTRRAAAMTGLAVALGISAMIPAQAATTTVQVTENDVVRQAHGTPPTNDWVLYSRDTGTGIFEAGPATPPIGTSSLGLTTTTANDKVYLFNYDHVGTPLSTVDAISYETYRQAGDLQQVTALNLEVDANGPNAAGGYTVLVFEPVYNTDQGSVVSGQWQDWDAYNGGNAVWWSSRAIPGVCAFSCYVTWNQILAANPDATIVGGFGVNQGGGNPGLDANTDALTLGYGGNTTVYDFVALLPAPTSKDQCKNDGWKTFNNPAYKNQGECVSAVAAGK